MLQLLYCNLYYQLSTNPKGEGVSCHFTETEHAVPNGTVFLEEAGCVPEVNRLLREEYGYWLAQGRTRDADKP